MFIHDVPKMIYHKFADDIVTTAVDKQELNIARELQHAVDSVVEWSTKWGMVLNVDKTKVMLFGESITGSIHLKINGVSIEQSQQNEIFGCVA